MMREYSKLMMPNKQGNIINIASISSLVGRDRSIYPTSMTPNPVAYTAAKAGLIGLTYDVAAYLGDYNIRVNCISPGGFERSQPQEFIKAYSDKTMLKRMGREGEDLKGAVVFLASEAASYITGHNLIVDGGFTKFK
jgi:NAD(P)-dependent dehydrogenase (short-subunit alcohol dehydrogenase family)